MSAESCDLQHPAQTAVDRLEYAIGCRGVQRCRADRIDDDRAHWRGGGDQTFAGCHAAPPSVVLNTPPAVVTA